MIAIFLRYLKKKNTLREWGNKEPQKEERRAGGKMFSDTSANLMENSMMTMIISYCNMLAVIFMFYKKVLSKTGYFKVYYTIFQHS